jgi:hypothetical protein
VKKTLLWQKKYKKITNILNPWDSSFLIIAGLSNNSRLMKEFSGIRSRGITIGLVDIFDCDSLS